MDRSPRSATPSAMRSRSPMAYRISIARTTSIWAWAGSGSAHRRHEPGSAGQQPACANRRQRARAASARRCHELGHARRRGFAAGRAEPEFAAAPRRPSRRKARATPRPTTWLRFRPRSAKPAASIRSARSPSAWTPLRERNGSPADQARNTTSRCGAARLSARLKSGGEKTLTARHSRRAGAPSDRHKMSITPLARSVA